VQHVHTLYQYLFYIENGMRGESGQPGIGLLWVGGQLAFVMDHLATVDRISIFIALSPRRALGESRI